MQQTAKYKLKQNSQEVMFPTDYNSILEQLDQFDPLPYAKTRNYGDGGVSKLSPYISRGVISTQQVFEQLKAKNYSFSSIEKFVQELAWRDYWQQVWVSKGDTINEDLKHTQADVLHKEIPEALVQAKTGIEVVDQAISQLEGTGYMHNHMRMYVAAIACNQGKSHWLTPAHWMFYHLLDADWASNALSWQWVAGSNANKKYIANQENINKYFHSNQQGTFLDTTYEEIATMSCPDILKETTSPELKVHLPQLEDIQIDPKLPTCIYNEYNLDPQWRQDEQVNRVFLFEPSRFEQYPMSPQTIEFIINLSKNIKGIQVYVGSFNSLVESYNLDEIIYKEHPLNQHYQGIVDGRDWLSSVTGYYPSFFKFWNKCKKEIKY